MNAALWNSSADLGRLLQIIRWLPVIAGIATVIAGFAVAVVSNRLDTLRRLEAADRHLSAQQVDQIAKAVKEVGGLPPFSIESLLDPEAHQLAIEFSTAFVRGGCQMVPGGMDTTIRPDLRGIFIAVGDANNPPAAALLLAKVLTAANLTAPFGTRSELKDGIFQLVVGRKPEPN